jgi:hypothetical protein
VGRTWHQEGEVAVCQGCRTEFQHRDFQVAKVIERRPQAIYEFEDLNGTHIDGQFYREELAPVRITDRTAYKIDKILDKRVRRDIREYLVRWRG